MTDKELWLIVRRALLMVCKAIEKKYMTPANSGNGHRPLAGFDSEISTQTPPIDHA